MGRLPFFRQIPVVRNTQNILCVRPVIMLAGYIRSGKTYVLKEIERRERKYCTVEFTTELFFSALVNKLFTFQREAI